MLSPKPIDDFLDYLRYQKRYSPHTLSSYEGDIRSFVMFAEKHYACQDFPEVTRFMVRDWLASFKKEGYATKSILRKKNSLKSFFKYLVKQNLTSANPAASLPSIKQEQRLVQYASEEDISKLFTQVEFPEGYPGRLHFIVLHLLYMTGMRVSELTQMRGADIDWSKPSLKVLGKGNKERIIPLSQPTIAHLKDYEAEKQQTFPSLSLPTFLLSEKGKPISRQQVYHICHHYLSIATTLNKKSPHILRHTFATHLLQNQAEISAIKELLGHASLAATQIYTHTDMSRIKKTYKNAHPRLQAQQDVPSTKK